jgi:membrane associated rhomboid family serine protease
MCYLTLILAVMLAYVAFNSFLFPLPINDTGVTRYRAIPWATLIMIIINTAIFVLWTAPDIYLQYDEESANWTEPDYERYYDKVSIYGYREIALVEGTGIGAFSSFSSMFMHADFWHLFFNMVYLWTFGRRVEDACGAWRFVLFYLLAGLLADLGGETLNPGIGVQPSIGASGAISGVMGAYFLLFPTEKVNCLWGIGTLLRLPWASIKMITSRGNFKYWRWTVTMPAWVVLIIFVITATVPSVQAIQSQAEIQGVHHLAHLAGLLAGLTIFLFVRKDLLLRYAQGRSL